MARPVFHHAPYPHDARRRSGHARIFQPARRARSGATTARGRSPSVSAARWAAARRRCCWRCAGAFAIAISLGVVTNDIFTKEDAEFLMRNDALPAERIRAVETGGCPHTAIRDDISPNLVALDGLMESLSPELLFVESGGDNLAAQFSRDLADYTIYVIDVSGGDKIPRKGGPGITQSDLLIINKTDLAPLVGADLGVMERDARKMRGDGPFLFTQVKNGVGVEEVVSHVTTAWKQHTGVDRRPGDRDNI